MKKARIIILLSCMATLSFSQENTLHQVLGNTDISGQWFLAYNYNENSNLNKFELKRGYFTVRTRLNDVFSVRYTQDITLDQEGEDMGNVETRLKYLFMKMKLNEYLFFENSYLEFGLVQRPWLDFEQKINQYRVQGKMFTEKQHLINSADFGATFVSLIGGTLDEEYQQNVNASSPGKYGSISLGIYNGGGYHAVEKNNNKTLEGRLSVRPVPDFHPGLQLTYAFAYGKSNLENARDYRLNLFYLSSESKYHVAAVQYYFGKGDYSGFYINDASNAINNSGYSLFGEFKIPKTKFALFSRYDYFIVEDHAQFDQNTFIGGVSYRFLKNKVLFHYNRIDCLAGITKIYELSLEVKF